LLEPPLLPGFGDDARCVRVRVFQSASRDETIYEIDGFWDRTVSLKDVSSGEVSVLYDAQRVIEKLTKPMVQDPKVLEKECSINRALARGIEHRQKSKEEEDDFLTCSEHVDPRCHRDGDESGAVPNVFGDLRSAVELLHGGDPWICSSRAIFSELELSQTRPK
jgi:hypothetical protein